MFRVVSIDRYILRFIQHGDNAKFEPLGTMRCSLEWWADFELLEAYAPGIINEWSDFQGCPW